MYRRVPPWATATLAQAIGARSARAVGAALGANPVGWLIPCHRVIRAVGGVGGYRWGAQRKRLMLAWEKARSVGYAADASSGSLLDGVLLVSIGSHGMTSGCAKCHG